VRIKKVLQPCKDSIIIVSKEIFVDRYKKVYESAKKNIEANEKMLRWWRKGALLTWAWIVLIGGVVYIARRK
jgi:CRISPR/Cas system type I-B associated protein Csh2 (Cas7 group RAMP superfamily)